MIGHVEPMKIQSIKDMFDWLYIDIPKENMGNKGENRQIPDQDFQYPIIPDWLNIWYQYPYPIRTRSDPKYFFQYPIHTRPEVKKPYPSDPACGGNKLIYYRGFYWEVFCASCTNKNIFML